MKADNDNDELSFISLAALTANVVRHLGLDEQKDDDGKQERGSGDDAKRRALDHREFVNRRLRDLDRFEKASRGK